MKNIKIFFDGYWREYDHHNIPVVSGIYCVYEGEYGPINRLLQVHRLLYIGMADNVQEAIDHHENFDMWLTDGLYDREILFSVGIVDPEEERELALSTLIYQYAPIANRESNHDFPFNDTRLLLFGKKELLGSGFTIYKTRKPKTSILSFG